MIELKILLDEINYDSLADSLVPLIAEKIREGERSNLLLGVLAKNPSAATTMAHTLLKTMSQDKRDELLVQLVSKNREKLLDKGQEFLGSHGMEMKLCDISIKEM